MAVDNVVVKVYTDGAYSRKDDCGGWGVVADVFTDDGFKRYEFSGAEPHVSSQKMELLAGAKALKFVQTLMAKLGTPQNFTCIIVSDSAYLIRALNEGWIDKWKRYRWVKADGDKVKNVEFWKDIDSRLYSLSNDGVYPIFHQVKGHDGEPGNERADKLAVKARKEMSENADWSQND